MSQATIVFSNRDTRYFFTLAEINALFASVATVLNAKMDVRGTVMKNDLLLVDASIINVPIPSQDGQLIGTV